MFLVDELIVIAAKADSFSYEHIQKVCNEAVDRIVAQDEEIDALNCELETIEDKVDTL